MPSSAWLLEEQAMSNRLLCLPVEITKTVDEDREVAVCYLDLSKALDSMS